MHFNFELLPVGLQVFKGFVVLCLNIKQIAFNVSVDFRIYLLLYLTIVLLKLLKLQQLLILFPHELIQLRQRSVEEHFYYDLGELVDVGRYLALKLFELLLLQAGKLWINTNKPRYDA